MSQLEGKEFRSCGSPLIYMSSLSFEFIVLSKKPSFLIQKCECDDAYFLLFFLVGGNGGVGEKGGGHWVLRTSFLCFLNQHLHGISKHNPFTFSNR